MARFSTGILPMLVLGFALAGPGCTGDVGTEDVNTPIPDTPVPADTVDAVSDSLPEEIDVEADVEVVVPVVPKIEILAPDGECECPEEEIATDWCGITNGSLEIKVKAWVEPEGAGHIDRVRLFWPEGEEPKQWDPVASASIVEEEDGAYHLEFELDEVAGKLVEDGAELPADGPYLFKLMTEHYDSLAADPQKIPVFHGDITIYLDLTVPKLALIVPPPDAKPFIGGKFVEELKVRVCALDDVSGPASLQYFLGEEEVFPEEPLKSSAGCPLPVFDVGGFDTEQTVFKVAATDCVGNVIEISNDAFIIGLPHYRLPPKMPMPRDDAGDLIIGSLNRIKVYNVDDREGDDVVEGYPDLVALGAAGIAFSISDPDSGELLPFEVKLELSAVDVHVLDVSGDGFKDIVALTHDSEGAAVVRIYLQETRIDPEKPGDPESEPLGTFFSIKDPEDENYVPPVSLPLPDAGMHLMEVFDANKDGFPDILVAGPNDTLSAALFLHTGRIEKKDWKEGERPVGQPEQFYGEPDIIKGMSSISDVVIGDFMKEEGEKDKDKRDEVVFTKSDMNIITTYSINEDGTFGIGRDTIYCWGGIGMALARDLGWWSTDDLLIATGHNTVHYVPSKGDGKFLHGGSWPDKEGGFYDPYCFCANAVADDPEWVFGQKHIPNVQRLHINVPVNEPPEWEEEFLDAWGMDKKGNHVFYSEWDESREIGDMLFAGGPIDSMAFAEFVTTGLSGGWEDLAVAVPDKNYIAIFAGRSTIEYQTFGKFSESLFINPGTSPRSLVTGDFDGDSLADLACIVGVDDTDSGVVVLRQDTSIPGGFPAPIEIPMPVSGAWQSGRLVPTHFVVAPIEGGFDTNDIVVATQPEKQVWFDSEWQVEYKDEEDKTVEVLFPEEQFEKSLPLILAYRFAEGEPHRFEGPPKPDIRPYKSTVDVNFDQALTGLSVGNFDKGSGSQAMDLVVSIGRSFDDACTGRTFDILVGGWQVVDFVNPVQIGTDEDHLDYYSADGPLLNGYFRPMGGYFGLRSPTGIVATNLNLDEFSDIVMIAPEDGEPKDPDYQPHGAATYLARFDDDWNDCLDVKEEVWFNCAPYFPLEMKTPNCAPDEDEPPPGGEEEEGEGEEEEEPPPEDMPWFKQCLPSTGGQGCKVMGPAWASDRNFQWESGDDPVDVVVGDFYPDELECMDIMVANSSHDDVTYLVGLCDQDSYNFHSLSSPQLFNVGAGPVAIQGADLDGDGEFDVIAALAKNISIVYGVDGEEFESPVYLLGDGPDDVEIAPTSLVVEDVNVDGWPDFLVTEASQDQIMVFLNGGERDFYGPYPLPCGKDPIQIEVAELDGDDCSEVAVLNEGSRTVTILHNMRCEK